MANEIIGLIDKGTGYGVANADARYANINIASITSGTITGITDLSIADGGTGASTAAAALTNLGLDGASSPTFAAVNVDSINEKTSAHGVNIDGALIKDGSLTSTRSDIPITGLIVANTHASTQGGYIGFKRGADTQGGLADYGIVTGLAANRGLALFSETGFPVRICTNGFSTTKLMVNTNGDVIIGADTGGSELLRVGGDISVGDNTVKTNHIAEVTSAHGVDIDGVLCKDGRIKLKSVANVYDIVAPAVIKGIYKQHKTLTTANKNRLNACEGGITTEVIATNYGGSVSYYGGVLLPDGRVFCVPCNATSLRIFNPADNTTEFIATNYGGSSAYNGGVLLPDGRVFCVPCNATSLRIFNPADNTTEVIATNYGGGAAYCGGVLLPDGRVFCVPRNATSLRIFNPADNTTEVIATNYVVSGAYYGGVLLPDGRVFCVPFDATSLRIGSTQTSHASLNFPMPLLLGGTLNKL